MSFPKKRYNPNINPPRIGTEYMHYGQKRIDEKLHSFKGKTDDARKIISILYQNPIIDAQKVEKIIAKSHMSAYKQISILENLEIIKEITGGQRGKIYAFQDYLKLFKS
jgi:Fic family protein